MNKTSNFAAITIAGGLLLPAGASAQLWVENSVLDTPGPTANNAPGLACDVGGTQNPGAWAALSDAQELACRNGTAAAGACPESSDLATPPQTEIQYLSAWHQCQGPEGSFQVQSGAPNPAVSARRAEALDVLQKETRKRVVKRVGNDAAIQQRAFCAQEVLPAFQGCGSAAGEVTLGNGVTCGESSGVENREAGHRCLDCRGLPPCLFVSGDAGNSLSCGLVNDQCSDPQDGQPGYSAQQLDQFPSGSAGKAQVTALLDAFAAYNFERIAKADRDPDFETPLCDDIKKEGCRGRDPAYWAQQALGQEVLNAWRRNTAKEIMLVLDRSGSMYYDGAVGERRVDQAAASARLFAAMMKPSHTSGAMTHTNRIGLVSFGSEAGDASKNAAMATVATAQGNSSQYKTALNNITTNFVDAATSIGAGLEAGATALCGSAPCDGNKAFVVLTDGLQNTAPCIPDSTNASRCTGTTFDTRRLGNAHVCAIGYGPDNAIDTQALSELTEGRGITVRAGAPSATKGPGLPDNPTEMMKAFTACAANMLDTAAGSDPAGVLSRRTLSTKADHYDACSDKELLFVAGWGKPTLFADEMMLLVNDPNGNLVRAGVDGVTGTTDTNFNVARVENPEMGTWRTQVVRHHTRYVNGFAPDAFEDAEGQGMPLVRRQIQRLCPTGCQNVLHYEETASNGQSVYDLALKRERDQGLVGNVSRASTPTELLELLNADVAWNLIIYVNTSNDVGARVYDRSLRQTMCRSSVPAIVTDMRPNDNAEELHFCSGALRSLSPTLVNYTDILDSDDHENRLIDGTIKLKSNGLPVFSYGVGAMDWLHFEWGNASEAQARNAFDEEAGMNESDLRVRADAIVATSIDDPFGGVLGNGGGDDVEFPIERNRENQTWFSEIHFKGVSLINAHQLGQNQHTGSGLRPQVSVPIPYQPKGGFTSAKARVIVEYPLESTGKAIIEHGCSPDTQEGDSRSSRELAVKLGDISTGTMEVELNDQGLNGDAVANNLVWSADVPSLGTVDGTYNLRYLVDFTYTDASGKTCTQHREAFDSVSMAPAFDPEASIVGSASTPEGRTIRIKPQDQYGNPLGCGASIHPTCDEGCNCAQVFDHGDGSYTVTAKGPTSLGCNCFSMYGEQFCAGPKIIAPDVTANVCVESATEVLLDVQVTNGTATGRVLDQSGAPTGDVISTDDPRVLVPVGVTKIKWTATDGTSTVDFVQTVTVKLGSDRSGNCCPEGMTVLTGTDLQNFFYVPDSSGYCVLGLSGGDHIVTGPVQDVVFGGDGGDAITNSSEGGFSAGGLGDDSLVNALGGDLHGGAGQDFIYSCADSELWGNTGDDSIVASAGKNYIYPNAGRDVVTGGPGQDVVTLFDTCELTHGKVLDGGPGKDTLVTPVPVKKLLTQYGVVAVNFEKVVVRTDLRYLAQCK